MSRERDVRIVGSVLVRNEDVHIERAIRNVADACDRIHVLDHLSNDRTPEILAGLSSELEHLEVRRSADAGDSHRDLEQYVVDLSTLVCGPSASPDLPPLPPLGKPLYEQAT